MIDFTLLTLTHAKADWQALFLELQDSINLDRDWLATQNKKWQLLNKTDDKALTDWLIFVFNHAFCDTNTILVRGGDEPEYLAATYDKPAQIIFAHGYFSSSLHELSHWCIAGKERRKLNDFGYWYCPDGRDQTTQKQFEQVEIKPQAIECLLTLATNRKFFTSADNLTADFDTSFSTFDNDVFNKAKDYLKNPKTLPKDAKKLLTLLLWLCQNENILHPPR